MKAEKEISSQKVYYINQKSEQIQELIRDQAHLQSINSRLQEQISEKSTIIKELKDLLTKTPRTLTNTRNEAEATLA